MLGAGSGEERSLCPARHLRAVQDEAPKCLAELRPARLAGRDHVAPERDQVLLEQPRLGRLPRAVHSFDAHEHAQD
jgi:hypothetical protein